MNNLPYYFTINNGNEKFRFLDLTIYILIILFLHKRVEFFELIFLKNFQLHTLHLVEKRRRWRGRLSIYNVNFKSML